jgi:hypothetical protein
MPELLRITFFSSVKSFSAMFAETLAQSSTLPENLQQTDREPFHRRLNYLRIGIR